MRLWQLQIWTWLNGTARNLAMALDPCSGQESVSQVCYTDVGVAEIRVPAVASRNIKYIEYTMQHHATIRGAHTCASIKYFSITNIQDIHINTSRAV
jgi:hypothetical protein